MQTWVEGVPVKGKTVMPAKPTKAAALQVLQQLASEHCSAAQELDNAGTLKISTTGNSKKDLAVTQPADAAVGSKYSTTGLSLQEAGQPELVLPGLSADQRSDAALNSMEPDSDAEECFRGGVADEEEDDSQAPEVLVGLDNATAGQHPDQNLMAQSAFGDTGKACIAGTAATSIPAAKQKMVSSNAPDRAAKGQSRQMPLSKVIQQQRRRMSKSNIKVNGQLDVVLALTNAQQQQMQQEAEQQIFKGAAMGTASTDGCSLLAQQTGIAASPVQQTDPQTMNKQLEFADQQPLNDQRAEHGIGEEGSSDMEQHEQQLWQNLAQALQDQQSSQKLAQLTVTLLARM